MSSNKVTVNLLISFSPLFPKAMNAKILFTLLIGISIVGVFMHAANSQGESSTSPVNNTNSPSVENVVLPEDSVMSPKTRALADQASDYSKAGDYNRAVNTITQAINNEPNFAALYYARALFRAPIEEKAVTKAELNASILDIKKTIDLLKKSPPKGYDSEFILSCIQEAESSLAYYQEALMDLEK